MTITNAVNIIQRPPRGEGGVKWWTGTLRTEG
jgi:hypothetical protein